MACEFEMQTTAEDNPSTADSSGGARLKPRLLRSLLWLALVAGAVYGLGSIRHPANLNKPLSLHGEVSPAIGPGQTLRIGTFNIHSGKGIDGRRDLKRVARQIEQLDIVGLNEVRGGYFSNQAGDLGEILDMGSLFAPMEWRWGRDNFGNGLLTKVKLQSVHRIPLTCTRHSYRNMVLTQFQFGGETVRLLLVHIDLWQDRETQLRAAADVFLALQSPAILMGDLNTTAESPLLQELLSKPGVRNALADVPGESVDWVITRGLRTVSARSHENDASDHPVVIAELELESSDRIAAGTENLPTDAVTK